MLTMTDDELTAALCDLARRIEMRGRQLTVTEAASDRGLAMWRKRRAKLEAEQRSRQRVRLVAAMRTRRAVLLTRLHAAYDAATQLEQDAAELDELDRLVGAQPRARVPVRQVRSTLEGLLQA